LNNKKFAKSLKGKATSVDVSVGNQLRRRRMLMGLSQEELANSVGISFQQIQKYENGLNRISASRLYEFGMLLDVPVKYFFASISEETKKMPIISELSEDVLYSKETAELLSTYYKVEDRSLRQNFLKLLKSMTSEVANK